MAYAPKNHPRQSHPAPERAVALCVVPQRRGAEASRGRGGPRPLPECAPGPTTPLPPAGSALAIQHELWCAERELKGCLTRRNRLLAALDTHR